MMIKRFLSFACLAICACFGSAFASTVERPVSYMLSSLQSIGEFHGASVARLDIALVHWRSGAPALSRPRPAWLPICAPRATTS